MLEERKKTLATRARASRPCISYTVDIFISPIYSSTPMSGRTQFGFNEQNSIRNAGLSTLVRALGSFRIRLLTGILIEST